MDGVADRGRQTAGAGAEAERPLSIFRPLIHRLTASSAKHFIFDRASGMTAAVSEADHIQGWRGVWDRHVTIH
jgi:hypothetical protein